MSGKVRRVRSLGPARPVAVPRCLCDRAPYPVATWRNECLVSVVRAHWPGCPMPPEPVDPDAYIGLAGPRRYAPPQRYETRGGQL
jgi:hypothetical protein